MYHISFDQKENECFIRLEGRIDSSNAHDVMLEMERAIPRQDGIKVNTDFQNLEYISSAGLRVILKLKKDYQEVKLVNVPPAVYDILEATGFTSMLPVSKVLREISIQGCEELGFGMTGRVYRLDMDTLVKVFYPGISLETAENERNAAKTAFISGIPTAISYELATCGGCYAIIFEQLKAKTVSELIQANPEMIEEYGIRMGRLLKQIHTRKAADGRAKDIKAKYVDRCMKMREWLTEEETQTLVDLHKGLPDTQTLLHGDFHSKNVMEQDGELLLIDMGDVGCGHPILDWAGIYLSYIAMNRQQPNGTLQTLGLNKEQADILWRKMLETYFDTASDKEIRRKEEIIRLYGMARSCLVPVFAPNFPEEYKQQSVKAAKEVVIPLIRRSDTTVDF